MKGDTLLFQTPGIHGANGGSRSPDLRHFPAVCGAIRIVARLQDGSHKVLNIAEVPGVSENRIDTQDILVSARTGVTDADCGQGRYRGTGHTPKILERLGVSGINVPAALFEETLSVNL